MTPTRSETGEERLARHNREVLALVQEHRANIQALRDLHPGQSTTSTPSPLSAAIQEEHAKFARAAQILTDRHRNEAGAVPAAAEQE